MNQIINEATEKDLNYYLAVIHNIVYAENRWISVINIADKLGILWNQNLLENRSQSTIGRIISMYMKDRDVNFKKTQYRDGYDLWVAPKEFGIDLLPESAWNLYEYRQRLEYNKRVADKNLQADAKTRFNLMANNQFVAEYLKRTQNLKSYNIGFSIVNVEKCEHECKYNEPMIYTNDFKVFVSPDCKSCSELHPQYFKECIKYCTLTYIDYK